MRDEFGLFFYIEAMDFVVAAKLAVMLVTYAYVEITAYYAARKSTCIFMKRWSSSLVARDSY